MALIKRHQFLWDFFKKSKGIIPSCYTSLDFDNVTCINKSASKDGLKTVNYISLFPDFFKPKLVDDDNYKLIKVFHYGMPGTGILLNKEYTYDSYKKEHIKKSFLKGFRRTLRRLETCFDITYEYNYGEISKEKYEFLLKHLFTMLNRRFKEKKTNSVFLDEWDKNTSNLFSLINQKRSSLFVVYNGNEPISISLNRHIDENISFSECHAYNIDYSKFGLGHIDNYLLLNWSIKNNVYFLDLGLGNLDYKGRWCNKFYDLEYHIYYKKNSPKAWGLAYLEVLKIKLKNLVKKLKIDQYINRIRNGSTKDVVDVDTILNTEEFDISKPSEETKRIEFNSSFEDLKITKRIIIDFLYTYEEHSKNVAIFQSKSNPEVFFLKGEKKGIKLIF